MLKAHGLRTALAVVGYLKGGPVGGFVANRAGEALAHMKAAGITQVGDLVTEAMLHPGLARVLLAMGSTLPGCFRR